MRRNGEDVVVLSSEVGKLEGAQLSRAGKLGGGGSSAPPGGPRPAGGVNVGWLLHKDFTSHLCTLYNQPGSRVCRRYCSG